MLFRKWLLQWWVKSFAIFWYVIACNMYITWTNLFKLRKWPVVIGSIAVGGALTYCALLQSVCYLKTALMNLQHCLIHELMIYAKITENIYCVKGICAVDPNIVIRWLKRFCLGCKNLDNQARSGRPKTVNSKTVLKALGSNLVGSIRRESGEFGIS